jgi:hypothetical protein
VLNIRCSSKGCSTVEFPCVVKIQLEITTTLKAPNLFYWNVFILQCKPQACWCVCSIYSISLKHIVLENRLLHLQPFTNSYFHFITTVEIGDLPSATSLPWIALHLVLFEEGNLLSAKCLISKTLEFLNLCQGGRNASVCLGIMLKNNNDTYMQEMSCI